ncbi:MAG: mannose-1-phosphate guanylyltransferase [Bacteroidales bacterium]|nr:mannose-1-phosphate guanylyltransferase [Bacteroidales bacterium]
MSNNYCVIMGGGIGSRFWPFSRQSKPKQFLDLLGVGKSLLQMTYDRFRKIIPKENIFIATNQLYIEEILKQLPELSESQILVEPTRRNTAPCVAYSTYRIHTIDPEANIVVAPSDHIILQEDIFLENIHAALNFVRENEALATLGIKPTRPETGYGYIQSDVEEIGNFKKVKTFTEKPDLELAKVFFAADEFYWNSGIFIWNVRTIMKAFHEHMPEVSARFDTGIELFNTPQESEFIASIFPYCPNISIDYGIMEKADNVYMLPAQFGWSDLGTWGALHELAVKDDNNNTTLKKNALYYESEGNIVAVPEGKLCVIQGLKDYIVAESGNALLICRRSDEQSIKQFVMDANLNFGEEFN